MTSPPPVPGPLSDLTEGWPDDPENAELARLAHELRTARPQLSSAALERVRHSTGEAVVRAIHARKRSTWNARVLGAAAMILLAVFLRLLAFTSGQAPVSSVRDKTPSSVTDTYTLNCSIPAPARVDRAVVSLQRYASLYRDSD